MVGMCHFVLTQGMASLASGAATLLLRGGGMPCQMVALGMEAGCPLTLQCYSIKTSAGILHMLSGCACSRLPVLNLRPAPRAQEFFLGLK